MQVRLFTRYEDLASRSDAWNALARGAPFLRWEWLGTWWRHYGRGGRLFVPAVLDDGENLVGLAPWYLETHPALGRVIRFLGSGEVCTDYLSLLAAEGMETAVADAIAAWLTGDVAQTDRWDLVELDGAAKNDPAVWRLIEQLAMQGNTLHRRDGLNCWRIELPVSWDEFLGWQSKTHRKQIRRALGRLEEGDRAAIHTAANADELARAWSILVDLHQRRRKSLGEPGCFASKRFHDFLREASDLLLAAGALRLTWLEFDGRPAAAEYVVQGQGVFYAYQAGVDPERLEEEPGRMISGWLIQRAIEERQRGFDFLRGDEPYKAHWRAKPRRLAEWRVVPQRAMPQLRHTAWLAGGAMKHWLKNACTRWSAAPTTQG